MEFSTNEKAGDGIKWILALSSNSILTLTAICFQSHLYFQASVPSHTLLQNCPQV
jgi:hypothetical protein